MAPTKTKPTAASRHIDVDLMWQMDRVGPASLSPDGAQAVASVARYDMAENQGESALWLLSTLGGAPRRLTTCGRKDGQPRFSPLGDRIAFLARREQQGRKDEETQLYLIAPDGGEASRAAPVATGVEAFRWFPDGQRIAFISWVWPGLKGSAAQAKRHQAFKERKETGYVTGESLYRYWDHFVPQERVAHLHVLDLRTGKVTDLFEGTPYELSRCDPDDQSFDISPDGRHLCFAWDPSPEQRVDARHALVELDLRSGQARPVVQDAEWDCGAPRYSPEGDRIAFTASHQGRKHTLPNRLAMLDRAAARWEVLSEDWDREVHAPLRWDEDATGVLLLAEEQGHAHLWRFDLARRHADVVVAGGTIAAYDLAAGTLVTLADSAAHPARLTARRGDAEPRRIETFNDALMDGLDLGLHEEVWYTGALGEPVQMWLHYPPGFDPKQKYPVLHSIHGGPHTAPGDNWHWRWNNKVFAAQGYVVACVNYHGSSSFGHAFLDSITHRWGELELQDIEAATDWLLKKRWVDRRRVFATGGSYGGYMVAWMNGHVPAGRYAAYICHAGCFDWTAMFADDAWAWHAKELGAWYWEDPAQIARQSPHVYAGAMNTPTLVIHGALDYRVPDAQGLAYYNTLKARGVDARLLWFPDENHWVLKPRNSAQWYREFFDWLRRHDPARVDEAAAPAARPQRRRAAG